MAVFRDELRALFPHDEDADRLWKQVFTLAEFMDKKAPGFKIPSFPASALVHVHCHEKSVLGKGSDKALFERIGLDHTPLDSGCCGMAGYFGYEAGKPHEVGRAAGERVLLPAVRKADATTLIIADGFSCREQIAQNTKRKGLHTAQVLQMALREENTRLRYPEERYVEEMKLKDPKARKKTAIALLAVGVIVASAVMAGWRKKQR
ncbi:MAG: hypothetical protein JST42_15150 [Bacteroidetes bacterium]|nr:hypothetical protein [Bacteroidota bacterium]